jgi:glycerol kinase
MTQFIAAIDQGTTSTRCMIFNHSGQVVTVAQKEHRQIYPQPGWVEHDPLEIWQRTQEVVKEAQLKIGHQSFIAGLGITNQRETALVWNRRTGQPYSNAIVWQDTRTKEICDELAKSGGQDRFRAKTGLPLATYFSGPKVKWLLDNLPGLQESAERGEAIFGNIDTWLIWWLTGGPQGGAHVTDVTNASRTLMMNLEALDWDDEILDILGIPPAMLPRIVASSDPRFWGATSSDGPFNAEIPVCGDLGDQQAALVGQA